MDNALSRRIGIGQALILIAAITPGLILIRTVVRPFRDAEARRSVDPPPAATERLFDMLTVEGGSLLIGLAPTVMVIGVLQARRSHYATFQEPGFIACFLIGLAAVRAAVWLAGYVWVARYVGIGQLLMITGMAFEIWLDSAACMIVGGWTVLFLLGRWRPGLGWVDRAGCLIGGYFVTVSLSGQFYEEIIKPLQR